LTSWWHADPVRGRDHEGWISAKTLIGCILGVMNLPLGYASDEDDGRACEVR
jgi:hypothetical protein